MGDAPDPTTRLNLTRYRIREAQYAQYRRKLLWAKPPRPPVSFVIFCEVLDALDQPKERREQQREE